MGRCGSCRTQAQRFCFVHQEFVCDACLVSDESRIHNRCVVNTYRKWVQDSSYDWPPKCSTCSLEFQTDDDTIRRSCMHLEHTACVEKAASPDYACGACGAPLEKSMEPREIGKAIQKRIQGIPSMKIFVNKVRTIEDDTKAVTEPSSRAIEESSDAPSTGDMDPLQAEKPRNPYRRQSATLQVIETDVSENVSQVSHEVVEHSQVEDRSYSQNWQQQNSETRIDMGLPKQQPAPSARNNISVKRDKNGSRVSTSALLRKAWKVGGRYWMNLRKSLSPRQKQVGVIMLVLICLALAYFLMSGEEEFPPATKPTVEEVNLPHIRINPAIRAGAAARRLAEEQRRSRNNG